MEMELSEFVLRALLLFLPGIICAFVVDALTVHRDRKPFDLILLSFVFGMAAYFEYWLIVRTTGPWINQHFGNCLESIFGAKFPTQFIFLNALQDKTKTLSFSEIGFVCLTSFAQGLILSALDTYKIPHRLARALRITRRSGELDVWGFTFNSPNIQFATIRDLKNDLVYDGWIQSFADDAKNSELLLRDVAVFRNSDGNFLYSVGALYLCIEPKNVAIEFRDVPLTLEFQRVSVELHEQRGTKTSSSGTTPRIERGDREEGRTESATDERSAGSSSPAAAIIRAKEAVILLFVASATLGLGMFLIARHRSQSKQ